MCEIQRSCARTGNKGSKTKGFYKGGVKSEKYKELINVRKSQEKGSIIMTDYEEKRSIHTLQRNRGKKKGLTNMEMSELL